LKKRNFTHGDALVSRSIIMKNQCFAHDSLTSVTKYCRFYTCDILWYTVIKKSLEESQLNLCSYQTRD